MKRFLQNMWIAVLALAAITVGSCSTQKNAAQRERLQHELDSVNQIIHSREGACIYGSPEVLQQYGNENRQLKAQADSLQKEIDKLK